MKATKEKKPLTVYDIARIANVSPMTVSIALRPEKGRRRVGLATRQRIIEVAERLHYKPNLAAKVLRSAKTNHIGFYLNQVETLYLGLIPWRRLVSSMQTALWQRGYRLGYYHFEPGKDEGFSDFLIPNRFIDGMVVQGRNLSPAEIDQIRNSGMPTASLYESISGFHSFEVDEAKAGADAADYLFSKGHRQIAMLAGVLENPKWNGRVAGFLKQAEQLGIPVHASHQFTFTSDVAPLPVNNFPVYKETGPQLYRRFIDSGVKATALYIPSGYLALPIIEIMDQTGVRLGRDISMLSYDNLEEWRPDPSHVSRLTSFNPPLEQVGGAVARFLSGETDLQPPQRHLFAPTLVERSSVAKI